MRMSQAGLRLAVVLFSGIAMTGCDGKQEAETGAPKDRTGAAFEEKLEGCAAVADRFGDERIGKPFGPFGKMLETAHYAHVSATRVIRPGDAVTRDYRTDRLNIMLDDKDVVTKLYCG